MLRSALMVGVIALCCAGVAQSAEAQHGGVGMSHGSFAGRGGFARFQSPRFERRPEVFQNRRFLAQRRFFDRDRDDRFFFRDRFRFGDRFRFRDRFPFDTGFGFGLGGFPYYPYDTGYGGGYYPYVSAAPPDGYGANVPLPSTQVADLPPCRESGAEGVVILRGSGCAHGKP